MFQRTRFYRYCHPRTRTRTFVHSRVRLVCIRPNASRMIQGWDLVCHHAARTQAARVLANVDTQPRGPMAPPLTVCNMTSVLAALAQAHQCASLVCRSVSLTNTGLSPDRTEAAKCSVQIRLGAGSRRCVPRFHMKSPMPPIDHVHHCQLVLLVPGCQR